MKRCAPCLGVVIMAGCLAMLVPFAPQELALFSGPFPIHSAKAEGIDPIQSGSAPLGMKPIVIIDPGHGGNDEGAKGYGMKEKDLSIDVATHLQQILQQANFPVLLTRYSDAYVPLSERVDLGNKYDHALFISIHFNQSADTSANGAETYYAKQKFAPDFLFTGMSVMLTPAALQLSQGKELAEAIQQSVTGRMIVANRGVKGGNLYVVSNVRNPAVLLEAGFVSSPFDSQQIKSPDYAEQLAGAIAQGIILYQSRQGKLPAVKLARVKN